MYPLILVGYISSICALACCGFDKTVPTNYILLCVFTFCTGWMVSIATIHVKPMIVLEAACLTVAMVFAITLYAMTTSTDFTVFGPLLWIFGMVFGVAGIFLSLFGFTKGLLWSTIGVILFSFYLLYDTQLIMGGENKSAQFDEDSYILAAITLYLDIINIFLYVLQILSDMSSD
jgi:protein lifeguard